MISSKYLFYGCTTTSVRLHSIVRSNSGGNWFSGRNKQAPVVTTREGAAPLHKSTITQYPAAAPLPLPTNVEEFEAAEKACFSPERSRDISGPVISAKAVSIDWQERGCGKTENASDPHVASYDCRGAVSLSSVMQTNVPQPFSSQGKSTYLNMPGGQWGQSDKYVAEELRNSHFSNSAAEAHEKFEKNKRSGILALNCFDRLNSRNNALPVNVTLKKSLSTRCQYIIPQVSFVPTRYCSTNDANKPLSQKQKLKQAVKDYGATVIVFHIGISLISLGGFYLAVSSGLDVAALLRTFGASDVAAGASTFVMAYAVHKVCAPVRIGITLTAAPFIVRYLRRIGVLKVKTG
ncbi:uncharacterized protein LOC126272635 isoform X1 [Schistocerca gregaria]|uniref:uncharacterized protein LOC126272635 isoform X1 n=1 Tax=Schistocerca gregaria TaxID=7010 RepID=UPI00211E2CB3|nr:uncharacterized protein LOC126272635 isoform X1 [Schistocerca gregaria]